MCDSQDEDEIPVPEDDIDLDDLLPLIGEFGRYQKLLIWLVCLPACIPCGFGAFNQLFMSNVPEHWCHVPQLSHLSQQLRKNIAIPLKNNKTFSSCNRYGVNWTDIFIQYELDDYAIELYDLQPNDSWPIEACLDGWEYSDTTVVSSIVIDFNLVCERDIYPTLGLAALNIGGPIGVYVFGIVSDRFGRKNSFFICLFVLILGNGLTALSSNFWMWAGSRIIVGLTIPAVYQIPFIISLELVGPSYRTFVTVMTSMFYTIGLMLLAIVAYFVQDWVYLSIASSLPFALYFLYWWFLPESPRWLLSKGRFSEAQETLEMLARVNKTEIPSSFLKKLQRKSLIRQTSTEKRRMKKGPGAMSLFRTPNMRLKTLLVTLNWFANDMVYVGLSYYGPALGDNEYLSFLLSSAVEIPGCFICFVIMDRWGRRWPLSICMLLSGFSCIVTVLLPHEAVFATLILYLFSKFTISASFLIIYPFAGELYPTPLRAIGMGTSADVAGLGLIIIPFVTYLGRENLVLPLAILGVVSIIGGITALRLPETLHHKLPQTLEEGEAFGKDWSFNDCFVCPQKERKQTKEFDSLAEADDRCGLEMNQITVTENIRGRRSRLARQTSSIPIDSDGVLKLTHWV